MKTTIPSSRLLKSIAAIALGAAALATTAFAAVPGLPLFYTSGVDLGSAGWRIEVSPGVFQTREYALLALNGGVTVTATTASLSNPSVLGDVGVNGAGSSIAISGNAYIKGRGFVRTGGGLIRSGLATLNPTPSTPLNTLEAQGGAVNARVNQAFLDAVAASNFAGSLATQSSNVSTGPTNFSISTSIVLPGGVHSLTDTSAGGSKIVLNLTDFILTAGAQLTLTGTQQTSLVINVSNTFSLVGGKIILNGINPGNVLFNVTGTGSAATLTSNSQFGGGIILAPGRDINVSGSSASGTLIGKKLNLSGNSRVLQPAWMSP